MARAHRRASARIRSVLPIVLAIACRSNADDRGDTTVRGAAAPSPAVLHDAVDRAARDRFRHPDRVVAALGLAPGQRVADVGAGPGYLTFRLADAVGPRGRVVATDVDDSALAALRAHQPARASVVIRKVAPDDPGLEPASYDLVLLSEVDHYLPDRVEYLRKLRAALAPGGRIAVTNRRWFRAPLIVAAERAGYVVAGEVTDLPVHFLVFLRPAPDGPRERRRQE
jgi:predicted methyltransferase